MNPPADLLYAPPAELADRDRPTTTTDPKTMPETSHRRIRPCSRSGRRRPPRPRRLAAGLLAAALALPALAAGAAPAQNEELRYRWHLGRLVGRIAGMFLPSNGDGVMTLERKNGHLQTELLITSEHSRQGEFWRYGSRIDARTGEAREAWSSYLWRGEKKSKRQEIEVDGVLDVVSGIWSIRRDPPTKPRQMEIWSDGKIYPVIVVPRGREVRKVAGRQVPTRHYTIRGYDSPDGRRWKGSLELWLAEDEAATPVEMHIERNLANLQLELESLPD